jgi:hypothetical protein
MQVTTSLQFSFYPEIKIVLWLAHAAMPTAHSLPQILRNTALHLAEISSLNVTDIHTWASRGNSQERLSNLNAMYSIGCPDLEESGLVHAFINLDQSDLFLPTIRL